MTDDQNELPLAGNVAVVTGGSSGLGMHFARVLHASGATVVVTARRGERLTDLVSELGDRAALFVADIADPASRQSLIDSTVERYGRIDILVNNAGVGEPAPAELELLEDFQRTIDINLIAVFHLAQLAGRIMLSQGGGAIVNVSSMLGLVASAPIPHAGYCASKGAVIALTRELGCQWASRGVRVNALAPGWFESEMTASMWTDERSTNHVVRNTPARRRGRLEELDAALLLLAGPGGSFIHGQTVVVDGGWTAR